MRIKITTKLDPVCAARLRRKARRYDQESNVSPHAFIHVGRAAYAPMYVNWEDRRDEVSSLHSVARHMMVVAGTTFRYEIVGGAA